MIIGIFLIPHFLHLFRLMRSVSTILSGIAAFLGIVSSISMSFIGIFPKDFKVPHFTFAGISFGGIFFIVNINLILLIKGSRLYQQQKSNERRLPFNFILKIAVIVLIHVIFNLGFFMFVIKSKIAGDIVPFWEWFYFMGIILWFISSALALPKK